MSEIEHIYVPKHIKISEKDVLKLLEKFNISKKQLPQIQKNDPSIKHLGAKPGEVIKIIRKSPTMSVTEFYRVVIE